MPQYRLTWAKVVDSEDFNELPDDTARVFWLLLPVRLDSAGRSYDDPQWLRSMIFPKRRDVTIETVEAIMSAFEKREMIVRYCVNGKKFFYVPSFKKYQRGTDKEAKSIIPPPHKKSMNSCATPALLLRKSVSDSDSDANTEAKAKRGANAPRATSKAPPAAPAKDVKTPAVMLYHSAMRLWPNTTQEAAINAAVTDIPIWQAVVEAWRMRGNKPTNVEGLLDWYRTGIPEGKLTNKLPRPTREQDHAAIEEVFRRRNGTG